MPAARASAGALPLTAPPPWSSDLRGTTGGQQVTTHYWAQFHNKCSFCTNNQTKAMGNEFKFPPPRLPLHQQVTSPNFNLQGCLGVSPGPTSIHHNSRQYCQSFGAIIQEMIDQKVFEGGYQMRFEAGYCKIKPSQGAVHYRRSKQLS